tara:strand:+ start:625 stop:1089 length:465 start_codon:yes stop_codon:yes gene_type:complete
MITEKQITRHLSALNKLHRNLGSTKYKPIKMTEFRRKYSIQSHTLRAMYALNYIEKKGQRKSAQYRWGPRSQPEPLDARRIIEHGLRLKNNITVTVKKNSNMKKTKVKKPVVNTIKKIKMEVKAKPEEELVLGSYTKISVLWGLLSYSKTKKIG